MMNQAINTLINIISDNEYNELSDVVMCSLYCFKQLTLHASV